jgi:mRNA interferase HigB
MHVISKRPLNEAAQDYPNQKQAIDDLYQVLRKGAFASPDEMKRVFPSLDNFKYKDKWWVIDIGGNNLRMITFIQFVQNRMYVKYIVTHAEYDKLCKRIAVPQTPSPIRERVGVRGSKWAN